MRAWIAAATMACGLLGATGAGAGAFEYSGGGSYLDGTGVVTAPFIPGGDYNVHVTSSLPLGDFELANTSYYFEQTYPLPGPFGGSDGFVYQNIQILGDNKYTLSGELQIAGIGPIFNLYYPDGSLFEVFTSTPLYATLTVDSTDYQTSGDWTISISSAPEPAAWGLLLTGFGAAGASLRSLRGKRSSLLSSRRS